jgi:multisubunit Na+/H+ antiporter MnhB subunit
MPPPWPHDVHASRIAPGVGVFFFAVFFAIDGSPGIGELSKQQE